MAEDKHHPTGHDGGIDRRNFSKEWLEQVINSSIQPRIEGIRINQISLCNSDNVLYAVIIPQATSRAPHQAKDKRYYKRFNFLSVPMEDYEIRDLLRRSSTPDLRVDFSFDTSRSARIVFDPGRTESRIFFINIFARNLSPEPAQYVQFSVFVDSRFKQAWASTGFRALGNIRTKQDIALLHTLRIWGPPHDHPVFAEATVPLTNLFSSYSLQEADVGVREFWLGYDIRAPGFSRSALVQIINDLSGTLTITDHEIPLEIVG